MEERNLDLSSRKENTREKFCTEVVRFELNEILEHFTETVMAIKNQFPIAAQLVEFGEKTDGENIWRAQIIFLASAFDFYMHELTKYGLCEIYNENWGRTKKYENLKVDMRVLEEALKSGEEIDWFLEYINGFYRTITMVSFESVKDQLNLLGIDLKAVADMAFYERDGAEKTKDKLERRLNELFGRRNFIAHQMDREHTDAQMKHITEQIVQNFIADTERIVKSIDAEARRK